MFKRSIFVLLLCCALFAPPASAATPSPGWTISSAAMPTGFSAAANATCLSGGAAVPSEERPCDSYRVYATNAGSEPTNGSPVTITDTLPKGVTLVAAQVLSSAYFNGEGPISSYSCSGTSVVRCEVPGEYSTIAPDRALQLIVYVTVEEGVSGALPDVATVSGGGAPEASTSGEAQVSSAPASFGPASFDLYIGGVDGTPDTQAGGHPFELTTTVAMNSKLAQDPSGSLRPAGASDVKDVILDLPLGVVGSTLSAPQCTIAQLAAEPRPPAVGPGGCPPDTQIGYIRTEPVETTAINSPLYNMVPDHGAPAEFGYVDKHDGTHALYAHVVPTPAGYVLQTTSTEVPQFQLNRFVVTIYGNPAARDNSGQASIPLLTNPTLVRIAAAGHGLV